MKRSKKIFLAFSLFVCCLLSLSVPVFADSMTPGGQIQNIMVPSPNLKGITSYYIRNDVLDYADYNFSYASNFYGSILELDELGTETTNNYSFRNRSSIYIPSKSTWVNLPSTNTIWRKSEDLYIWKCDFSQPDVKNCFYSPRVRFDLNDFAYCSDYKYENAYCVITQESNEYTATKYRATYSFKLTYYDATLGAYTVAEREYVRENNISTKYTFYHFNPTLLNTALQSVDADRAYITDYWVEIEPISDNVSYPDDVNDMDSTRISDITIYNPCDFAAPTIDYIVESYPVNSFEAEGLTNWLAIAVKGFFDVKLFGFMSFGGILLVMLSFSLFFAFIRMLR